MSQPIEDRGPEFAQGTQTVSLRAMAVPAEAERSVRDDDVPERFGRFRVTGELGKGAMGRVLSAFDPDLERTVALKVVPVGETNPALRERLLTEARIASQLEHPNIVPVYEMGAKDGWLYFAMRLIAGQSLAGLLKAKVKDEPWARSWNRRRMLGAFQALCRAVGYAHSQGVLHQDLKPSNVMIGELGEVQLLDWGIARSVRPEEEIDELLEGSGRGSAAADAQARRKVWGTPGYMSPERIRGSDGALDPRADIWALGVILYELVTLNRAFYARDPRQTLLKIVESPQKDPRQGNRGPPVPDELAEIVLTATAGPIEERFASVAELVEAVDAYLDGSRRRDRAARHLAEARRLWSDFEAVAGQRDSLSGALQAEEEQVPPWAPLKDKRRLLALRQELTDLEPRRALLFGRAVGVAEKAHTEDPGNREARRFLARAFWSRYLEAEDSRDAIDMTYFGQRVEEWDDGTLAEHRRGQGQLTLDTVPSGARVVCRRFDRDGLAYTQGPPVVLGTTPLRGVAMDMGSYVLTLRHPEREEVTYPVEIGRMGHWKAEEPVRLPRAAEVAPGFVYVAEGPFRVGGDEQAQDAMPAAIEHLRSFAIQALPIQLWEYCEFINALHRTDPEQAWARVPRADEGVAKNTGQYWERAGEGEEYRVPEVDREGDRWDPRWPVIGINQTDASAYAAWRSERDGRQYGLPTELEWEKAARGVDGRLFPWGDGFDPSLCRMRLTIEGRPQPEVVGAYPTDVSVYGMRDVAGGVRDWCWDEAYGGAVNRRPVRGGSWDSHAEYCRITHRTGYLRTYVASSFGMRLVQRDVGEG